MRELIVWERLHMNVGRILDALMAWAAGAKNLFPSGSPCLGRDGVRQGVCEGGREEHLHKLTLPLTEYDGTRIIWSDLEQEIVGGKFVRLGRSIRPGGIRVAHIATRFDCIDSLPPAS